MEPEVAGISTEPEGIPDLIPATVERKLDELIKIKLADKK